jgi:hypothetical protein
MPGPLEYEEIEALVRTGEDDERRKRRQFGLGKLLVWAGLAALLLGLLRMIGLGPLVLASICAWVAILAGVRLLFGSTVALGTSTVLATVVGLALALVSLLSPSGALSTVSRWWIPALAMIAMAAGIAGFWSYALLEVLFSLIHLPDGLLRGDSYDRQGPI